MWSAARTMYSVSSVRMCSSVGSQHVHEPAIAFERTDCEGKVSLTQSRMTALVAVGRRTSPVLDEEEPESLTRAGEIRLLGIET